MKTLTATIQFEFPDYQCIAIASMALPLYYVRLEVEVLEPRELTMFQTYLLKAIALGIATPDQLSWLLGVDEEDLAVPASALLTGNYITQGLPEAQQVRPLQLTPLGKQALEAQGPLPVPKRREGQLHFNAVTWLPITKEASTLSVDDVRKQGLPLLPPQEHRLPTLGDFSEREVNAALNGLPYFQDKEIIAILTLKKVDPEYVAPVQVVLLEHRRSSEHRLVVYRDDVQQEVESLAVQRLFDSQRFTMPREASLMNPPPVTFPSAIDPVVARSAQSLVVNETLLADITAELTSQQERRSHSQDDQERQALAEQIGLLEQRLQSKQEENEQLRASLAANQVTFLRTEDHRAFLEQVLRDAQEEVLIISPWLNTRACDGALCRLIGETAGRGVRIRIGYGFGNDRPGEEERHGHNAQLVQREIRRFTPNQVQIDWQKTTGTHQKIVVCDRSYCAIGSFNWLSYRGERDEGYRRETSSVFHEQAAVDAVAEIALEALQTMSRSPTGFSSEETARRP